MFHIVSLNELYQFSARELIDSYSEVLRHEIKSRHEKRSYRLKYTAHKKARRNRLITVKHLIEDIRVLKLL